MAARQIPPPIQPKVGGALDVHNFSDEFTRQAPIYSPVDSPENGAARQLFRV
jgi:hypothetical protein